MELPILDIDEIRKDLDETRRLCYMTQFASLTGRYNLAGTVVNAIVHHQSADVDVRTAKEYVLQVIEGAPDDSPAGMWVQAQIDRISNTLGD